MLTQTSDNEKNAAQLWAGFRRKKNEKFWLQYEQALRQAQLIQQTKASENTSVTQAVPQKANQVYPPKKYFPAFNYIASILICTPVIFILGVALILMGITSNENLTMFSIMGIIVIYLSGRLFWQLKAYETDPDGLTIYHGVFLWKKHFLWENIKNAYELGETRLMVSTYKKQIHQLPCQLSQNNKRKFYASLKFHLNK